jgi:hypothetical protein
MRGKISIFHNYPTNKLFLQIINSHISISIYFIVLQDWFSSGQPSAAVYFDSALGYQNDDSQIIDATCFYMFSNLTFWKGREI